MPNQDNGQHGETQTTQSKTAPRHWVDVAELDPGYWSDPATMERRGQEFHDKPIETLEQLEKMGQMGFARRDFLTIMGASMAMAGFACARRPVHKIIPYVVKPEEITPGVARWYASSLSECGSGILIKTREGRPIKLEGNPDHPVGRGALTARAQAAVLDLYDPDRLKSPMKGPRGGAKQAVTWEEVDADLRAKLRAVAQAGGRVRLLTAPIRGDANRRLIQEFLGAFKNAAWVEWDPNGLDELADAQMECYGTSGIPRYRFDQAEVVLSLGADFLGQWLSPVEHAADWAKQRKLEGGKLSKMYCFESMLSITGAAADERFGVRPGDELSIALSVASVLAEKLPVSDSRMQSVLASYKPEAVASEIGGAVTAAKIREIAAQLVEHRGRSLVVAGGLSSKGSRALELQIAANWLNTLLGNEGATVEGDAGSPRRGSSWAQVSQLASELSSGSVDVLIVHRANPLYHLPKRLGLADSMKRAKLVIQFTEAENETSAVADYLLADHHALESWGDVVARRGVVSLQQPALAPIHGTRQFEDSLLLWTTGLGATGGLAGKVAAGPAGSQPANGQEDRSFYGYLKAHWRETHYKASGSSASFEQFWEGVLRDGVLVSTRDGGGRSAARSFKSAALSRFQNRVPMGSGGFSLALYAKQSMGDGSHANNSWLQELPDPISRVTWDNYINISPDLAAKLKFEENDVLEIAAGDARLEGPARVQPGLHPQVVSVAVGYGRRVGGKVGTGVGFDVYPWVEVGTNGLVFSGKSVAVRRTGKFYKLAETQWHHVTEDRPIINDITFDQYKADSKAQSHTNPHLRLDPVPTLWPKHKYEGHRWGMAIDLNACTGCGACVIGCQAENNIPVVGRQNVRVSRQMHWIRIDRYYSGSKDNPDVIFQPMLCQHCENAPCETVCPVAATTHSSEGLNEQVYNRCVGTRYCQNNCPYKVRRFNFFDHWKSYDSTMNMVWNPDVTVRTRGIMEKCTFCVQRIRDAKDQAKDKGTQLREADLKTACQQTCPTGAITFGDTNNPATRVSKLKADDRAFRVLEVINTRPQISYLTRVRNKAGGAHGEHGKPHGGDHS